MDEVDGSAAERKARVQRATVVGLVAAIAMVAAALGVSMAFGDDGDEGSRASGPPSTAAPTTEAAEPTLTTPSTTAPPPTDPPTTPSTAPPTTTTTTTEPPTTTTTAPPSLESDLDGDGATDAVYLEEDEGGALRLRVELADGSDRTAAVEAATVRVAAVMGAADVDGDGRAEVFVRTNTGASTTFGSLFRLDGDGLVRVAFEGVGAEFAAHGSVRHLAGVRCTGAGIELSSAVSEDGLTYEVATLRYGPSEDPGVLALVDRETGTVPVDEVRSDVDCAPVPSEWSPGARASTGLPESDG